MVNGRFGWGDGVTKANLKNILTAVRDIINRSSEVGIRKAQAAEKRADNAQAAADNAQAAAGNAQTAANAAQTTADNAQTTANAAQTAADNAQSTADHKLDKNNPHGTGCFSLNTESSTAVQDGSVAFGSESRATGTFSFAHGGEISQLGGNEATGAYSHAEGRATRAIGVSAHAEGERTYAYGISSHAEGRGTIVHGNFCHVEGRFNKLDQSGQYAHVVGNGTENHLSNAYTLDWSGNGWFAGTVEGTALIIPSSTEGSTKKFKITVDDSGTLTATEVTA